VQDLGVGFGVWALRFELWALGFGPWASWFRITFWGAGCRKGFRVQGAG